MAGCRARLGNISVLAVVSVVMLVAVSSALASGRVRHSHWPMSYRVLHGSISRSGLRRVRDDRALSPRARESIVDGSQISIVQAPWQVFVVSVIPLGNKEALFLLCGGSIIGETHVVTAGHCMFDPETRSRVPTEDVFVVAGTSDFEQFETGEQEDEVSNVRVHPDYEYELGAGAPDDVAVLELTEPLKFNTLVQSIGPAAAAPAEGAQVNLTGFGAEVSGGEPEGPLHSLGMTVGFSGQCGGETDAVFLCASATDGSGCSGDSGSGLTDGPTPTLVGIMDTVEIISGKECLSGSGNGFVNVAAPEIRDFIEGSESPPIAPRGGGISLRAVAKVGYIATCESGSWSGSPTFSYTFMNSANDEVLQSGSSATYQLTKADVGLAISCEVLASNAGGTGVARTYALPAITDPEESGSGPSPGTPYIPPSLPWSNQSGNEAAARTVQEAQAERAAKELKSREESEAIERAQREVEAREEQPAKTAAEHCVVPSLKGDSLDKARRALSKAHCKLGKVNRPRGSSGGSLVVRHQLTAPGRKLAAGSRVGVILEPKK
jgi:Trypsin